MTIGISVKYGSYDNNYYEGQHKETVIFISIPGKQHKRTKGQTVHASHDQRAKIKTMAESAVVEELKCSICLYNFKNPKCCRVVTASVSIVWRELTRETKTRKA